jgi:hypothetical protein
MKTESKLSGMCKALQLFRRELDVKDLHTNTLLVFLVIAVNNKNGTTRAELDKALIANSSGLVSRQIGMLGKGTEQSPKAFHLIHEMPDPLNTKQYLSFLTKKGEQLAHRLEEALTT